MIGFPMMALEPAKQAGMKIPKNPESFDPKEYPHFHVFLVCQLGRSMPFPTSHWDNAKIIASIPDKAIKQITFDEILKMGFQ